MLDTRSPLQQQPSPFGPGVLLAKSQDADGDALRVNGDGHPSTNALASQSAPSTPPLLSSPPSATASPPISVAAAAPPASDQQSSVSVVNVTAQPLTVVAMDSARTSPATSVVVPPVDPSTVHVDPAHTQPATVSPAVALPHPSTQSAVLLPQTTPAAPAISSPRMSYTLTVPPADPVHPPLPTEVELSPLPPPPAPIEPAVIRSLTQPPPPPFPFNRRDFPVYSGPLDGTVALTGKYSYRYASGWYYVGTFRDSLRRGEGELYYSNGGDGYVLQPPADYAEKAPTFNRFIADGNAEMKAMDLMRNYPECFEPAGPRPAFRKTGQCEYPGCSGLLFYRPRHHCRQCGLNFCRVGSTRSARAPPLPLHHPRTLGCAHQCCGRCVLCECARSLLLHRNTGSS